VPICLLEVSYGYDAAGVRGYTRDMVATDRSGLYTHDAGPLTGRERIRVLWRRGRASCQGRDWLRGFQQGTLNAEGTAITALNDAVLPSAQPSRARYCVPICWLDSSLTVNGVTTPQTRTVNAVNEYLTIDPDGPGGPQPPVWLTHDDNGNLTHDPTARNAGDAAAPSGQEVNRHAIACPTWLTGG